MLDRTKKFVKEHKEEIAITGAGIVINGCVWYLIARKVNNGWVIQDLRLDNGDNPPPVDTVVRVFFKNGKYSCYGFKPEV